MSLLQEEREIILSNEYVDLSISPRSPSSSPCASKELFISHHFARQRKDAGAAARRFPHLRAAVRAVRVFFVEANVDVLPLTIDSNTRLNDYATAKKMLRLSEENDMDMLNGYPLVIHGYRTTRKMITHFNKPGQPAPRYAGCAPADRDCHRLGHLRNRGRTHHLPAALFEELSAGQGLSCTGSTSSGSAPTTSS